MAAYELKYTAEEIDGILESVDEKTIYGDATQSEHGLMSATDKAKLDSLPTSQQIESSLSGKVDKENGKGLSTNDYDKTAKDKVDAIPANPKYTDTTYEAGDGISIEDNVISATGGGGGGEENVIESISVNGTAQTVTNKNVDIAVPTKTSDLNNDSGFITGFTETDPTVPSWAKQPNKPSYDYSEISNTPTIPVVPTNVSAFNNDAGYLTQHQSLTDYVQKSQTAGLIKNDGTVDTTQYGTYSKPSGGIPASDLASGVIPTVPVQDVTVGGTSVVNNGTAVIPQEVFVAEYGVTTFQEVTTARNSGKLVLLPKDDLMFTIMYVNSSTYRFGVLKSTRQVAWYDLKSNNTWSYYGGATLETSANKADSISGNETDTSKYPSTKAVYDFVDSICGNIQTILTSI